MTLDTLTFETIQQNGTDLSKRLNDFAIGRGLSPKYLNMEWMETFRRLALLDKTYDSQLRRENPEEFIERTLEYQVKSYEKVRGRYEG